MATRPHGILLNSKPAQCSIYESGRMFYDASNEIRDSSRLSK